MRKTIYHQETLSLIKEVHEVASIMYEPSDVQRSDLASSDVASRAGNAVPRTVAAELISEREHIREVLAAYALWQLGAMVSKTEGSAWRFLAEKLGLGVDQMNAAVSEYADNPGYGTIMVWSRHKNSTIGYLRKTLDQELRRADLVEMLDKARQSMLTSTLAMLILLRTLRRTVTSKATTSRPRPSLYVVEN